MPFFSRSKKNQSLSYPPPASQQLQFPTKSQTRQSQPLSRISPWSVHTPPSKNSGKWPSPFSRRCPALSTTATAAGELFLFGGITCDCICNDQYVISTRDFSTNLLQTSGNVPTPRYGHCSVLTHTIFLIWGGIASFKDQIKENQTLDDSLYLLNLVSREWTRIVVNGPGPGGRYLHTMSLFGSKLFVFGGRTTKRRLNDVWALDLNCLESNPFWESYDPAPRNEKPLPRFGHVSVTTGDRIIIFGGSGDPYDFNDTWSFNISTRKWTELQCIGSIPSPRTASAAVVVDGVMYVLGGLAHDGIKLGDLSAFNLSTQRWITFQDIAPCPSGRFGHAMACDGTRVFVFGGNLSPDAHADETKLIHVLDIKHLVYPEPDPDAVNPSEMTTKLVQKSSVSHLTREQPDQRSSSSSDTHATHGASPFQKATPEEQDHLPSGKEIARLEDGRLIELERKLSETLVAKPEWDRHIVQLSARLEQAEANAAEEKKRARLELHELQAKLDESLLSRDHALEQAQCALQQASHAAEANWQSQRELTETRAELRTSRSEWAAFCLPLADTENGGTESKAEADTYRTQTATGLVNTNEDRVVHKLMERIQAMEAEIATLRLNEKSFEMMECRNEG